jgi:kynurenine formamidase
LTRKIVDLTMPIHEGMQTFPAHWHPFVEVTQLGRHGLENRETRKILLGTHTGTHIDAPRHFIPGGETVDNIPLEQLNGPATLVDLSDVPAFTGIDSKALKAAVGSRPTERVLLRFDWCKHLGTMNYYTDQPWLTEDAAQWLVDSGCRLIGMDLAMPDNPKNGKNSCNDSPNHKILLGAGVVILEYLVNLGAIGAAQFDLVVAPLKLRGGDGAPVRCFAVVHDVAR